MTTQKKTLMPSEGKTNTTAQGSGVRSLENGGEENLGGQEPNSCKAALELSTTTSKGNKPRVGKIGKATGPTCSQDGKHEDQEAGNWT